MKSPHHTKGEQTPVARPLAVRLFRMIRYNGCTKLTSAREIRFIIFSNMIWLTTYAGFIIYSVFTSIVGRYPEGMYWRAAILIHLLFLSYFFLVKYGRTALAKNALILTTYLCVTYYDTLTANSAYVFLCLFAFMPAAMNIFSFKENKIPIMGYVLFPLVYTVLTQTFHYRIVAVQPSDASSLDLQQGFNLILAFFLFLAFSTYMVLNSIAKQRRLLLKSQTLQVTLDNSTAAIWSIDRSFNLTTTNKKYLRSIENEFGISDIKTGVNIRNHKIWQKFPDIFRQQYYDVLNGNEILHEIQLNGTIFEIKGIPIYDDEGQLQGARFSSRDVTANRKTEQDLIQAIKRAEEAGATKARFLSNMSHELRTPLNGIIGITSILQDEKILPSQKVHLKTLEDLSEHTLQIVNNILDFAKIEAGKAALEVKRFNLKRFIEKKASLFRGTAKLKALQFNVETEGEVDIFLKGDEIRLGQVLINLLGNAFKFTEKGNVTLKIIRVETGNTKGCTLKFIVSDTGIGIKGDNLIKIFESFSQADSRTTRKFGGTGLGLSISEKIIELMGSRLLVESLYGKGTVFSFEITIPYCSQQAVPLRKVPEEVKSDLTGVNILLAEDNKVNQIVASRLLKKMNATVLIAENGKEAAECNGQGNFDIILMDLDMPVMDGYESAALIKSTHPHTPVIALTAAAFDDMHNFLANKGFDDVVQKPFAPDELLFKIASLLKRSA